MAHLDHKEAFEELKQRVLDGIQTHFPVEGRTQTLNLSKLEVNDEALHADDIRAQRDAKLEGNTWAAPVYATFDLVNHKTGKKTTKRMKVAEVPFSTRRYSYIVDGQEYQVDNQWQLKPGVYTGRRQSGELETRFNVPNKRSFDITFDPKSKLFLMERGKSANIPVYPLMKSMGIDDDTLERTWGKDVLEANRNAKGSSAALSKFFKADRRRAPKSREEAEKYFVDTMMASQLRPDATEVTLGKKFEAIEGDTFVRATKNMIDVQTGNRPEDDRDSLVFKDLRGVGDYTFDKLTSWDSKRSIRNKMLRKINQAKDVREIVKSSTFNAPIKATFTKNSAANPAKQINPIEMVAASMRTTIMGPGGIKSEHSIKDEAKLINPSHLGYLDPLHTPESEKTGVTLHLPMGVKKKGKEPTVPLYNIKTGKMERVPPATFLKSNVVLPDQVEWKDGKPKTVGKKVKFSAVGNDLDEGDFKDAQYVLRHPSHLFSVTSNLIPFMGNNSGNRASYATHHIEQAISLVNREEPLVQVGTGSDREGLKTFEEFLGRNTAHTAPIDGEVVDVKKGSVIIKGKDGKKREVQLYDNFPLNDPKAVLDSTPTVKKGQKVKAGQSIADTNFTKNGKLALGTNLNVAYIPYKGYNFEDGVVISESAAKKLSSVHLHKNSTQLDKETTTRPKAFRMQHPEAFTKDQYKILDDKGIVKKGTRVKPGDPLILGTKPFKLRDRTGVSAIRKNASGAHTDVSLRWDSDYEGEVVGVHKNKKGEVTVHVRTVEPMQIGDKIAGRYGNKGIVTQVVSDDEMPKNKKGDHVEVALNPSGVPGRMNVGQVLETAAAKIAKKTGKPYVVENFGRVEDTLSKVKEDLKKHGLEDTEELIDPKTGVSLGKALMGPQQMLKLTHQIDKKLSVRSGMNISGAPPESYDYNLMPASGGKTGGQSMGNLGMYAMLAHGAKANIREMQTWKSEGPDPAPEGKRWKSQHEDVWRAIQTGDPLPPPKSTFAFQKFTDMLRASGVNVEKKGNRLQLTPLTDKQIVAMAKQSGGGKLSKPSALTRDQLDENGEPKPYKGGLFDPETTGGHGGKKWSYFTLPEPMPNPVFEGAIQKVLGMKGKDYTSVVTSEKAVDPKTGKLVALGTAGALTGGTAIAHMLGKLDVKKELTKAKKDLEVMKVPKNVQHGASTTKLDQAIKRVKYLSMLEDQGLSAEEAYTLKHVPVIPPAMRPASVLPTTSGKTKVKWDDLNGLYKDLAVITDQMKHPNYKMLGDEDKKEQRAAVYDGLKALVGYGMSYSDRQDKNKGALLQIAGKYPKAGFFQKQLLSRRQDLTMRSTIVPEPAMGLDEVGLPQDKALTLFQPFVVKKLVDIGAADTPLDAQKILGDKKARKNKQVMKALDLVMEERPIMLKRDPALHKHSVQAFNARRVPGRAIHIHPLVTSGYNADFDGDTMSAFVPISKDAVQEAKGMYPSNNLFNEATGRVTHVPTLESALGLYKLSRIQGKAEKTFGNASAAIKAAQSGKLKADQAIKVRGVGTTTAGRLLISTALPEGSKLQKQVLTDAKMVLDKKGLPALYEKLAKEHTGDFGDAANKLKDLGYDASYGAVRIKHPDHKGPNAIAAAEDPKKKLQFLPIGTHTLSLKDFEPDKKTRDSIIQQTQRRVDMIKKSSLPKEQKDQRIVEMWSEATDKMKKKHTRLIDKQEDNLSQMLKAGVKPKWNQYQQMKLAPMLVEDSAGRTIPAPVTRSYAEGLDLAGYWTQMHGARKGSVQKVQEVRDPGYFSKQLINTTMNMQVAGRDCGTARGVAMDVKSKDLYDRELATDVKVKGTTYPKGTLLTPDLVTKIRSSDPNGRVMVRSPIKCEHGDGICQKCAGLSPNGKHYELGTNLGVLSAQSLGERAVQLTLKAFHSGGVAGGGGKTLGQFGRVNQLTQLPKKIPDEAELAKQSGTIQKIEHDKTGTKVWIGGKEHFVPLDRGGRRLTEPVAALQKVEGGVKWKGLKVGQKVEAGQSLSDPNRTFVNPHQLYRATGKMEKVQNHMVNELHGIFGEEGVRRQHVETVVKAMGNLTRVVDPGDVKDVLKGEYQPTSRLAAMNRELAKKGKRPAKHAPILQGIDMMPITVQEDWMAKLNHQRLRESIVDAAATGSYSNLHGTHPIPGMAYGAEFGRVGPTQFRDPRLKKLPKWAY